VSSQTNLTADTLTQTLLLFPEKNTNSFPGNLIKKELGKRNNVQLLKPAPDFSILTNAKEIFRLSDHEGTLTFLGFWTAGCKGCVESFPILRILDSTYSGKGLRMISVSLDQTEEVWKNALARYKLKWTQALDLSSFRKDTPTPIHELYNIGYYPQYFLIDNNGTIIYHNELSDDDLQYSKLRSIISSKLSKSE
jgi:peroxiredoxin